MYVFDSIKLVEIYCLCDDFCKKIEPIINTYKLGPNPYRNRDTKLSMSEMMTIEIFYHLSGFKCFKYYYTRFVYGELFSYFPDIVNYDRFVYLKPRMLVFIALFLQLTRKGTMNGMYYIDSAKLPVCHNLRIHSHKVFKDIAKRGKTSCGWFYGLKLHIIVNSIGQIVAFCITPGNTSDKNLDLVTLLAKGLKGKMFGDKGYISGKIVEALIGQGLQMITKLSKNMKNKLMKISDKENLKKRAIVESVFNILKSICNIDHTRHRSPANAIVNILGGIAAYSFLDDLPSIILSLEEIVNFIPKIM